MVATKAFRSSLKRFTSAWRPLIVNPWLPGRSLRLSVLTWMTWTELFFASWRNCANCIVTARYPTITDGKWYWSWSESSELRKLYKQGGCTQKRHTCTQRDNLNIQPTLSDMTKVDYSTRTAERKDSNLEGTGWSLLANNRHAHPFLVFSFFFLFQELTLVLYPMHATSSVLGPKSSVLNPKSSVLNPKSSVLNPKSSVRNRSRSFCTLSHTRACMHCQSFCTLSHTRACKHCQSFCTLSDTRACMHCQSFCTLSHTRACKHCQSFGTLSHTRACTHCQSFCGTHTWTASRACSASSGVMAVTCATVPLMKTSARYRCGWMPLDFIASITLVPPFAVMSSLTWDMDDSMSRN